MTANKMPEMPGVAGWKEGGSYTTAQMRDYGRACYLAGIAAARECVPAEIVERLGGIEWGWEGAENVGHNDCRETTLANLSALEQEAKK